METLEIPNKSTFKLNEVCGLTGVKPYVLRFWESEFIEIDPILSSSGQKLYDQKAIYAIAILKQMLFEEKMNIEQAKGHLETRLKQLWVSPENAEDSILENSVELNDLGTSSIPIERIPLTPAELSKLSEAKGLLREILI